MVGVRERGVDNAGQNSAFGWKWDALGVMCVEMTFRDNRAGLKCNVAAGRGGCSTGSTVWASLRDRKKVLLDDFFRRICSKKK